MTAGVWVDGHMDWVLVHEELERLAKECAELDGREGLVLLRAQRVGVHRHLGYASFEQYVERLFGYSARTTDDKLRTATALERLPELHAALSGGSLSWSAVRELARVATPDTEREWLEAARGKTVRQIEQLVSGKAPGARPSDRARPEARRHVLRFDVSAQTYATFREAAAAIRRRASEPMNDDALLLQMARDVLRGPSDTGRSSYQVAVAVCESCQRGVQRAAGTDVALPPEVVEMIACDAQLIGRVAPGATLAQECGASPEHEAPLTDADDRSVAERNGDSGSQRDHEPHRAEREHERQPTHERVDVARSRTAIRTTPHSTHVREPTLEREAMHDRESTHERESIREWEPTHGRATHVVEPCSHSERPRTVANARPLEATRSIPQPTQARSTHVVEVRSHSDRPASTTADMTHSWEATQAIAQPIPERQPTQERESISEWEPTDGRATDVVEVRSHSDRPASTTADMTHSWEATQAIAQPIPERQPTHERESISEWEPTDGRATDVVEVRSHSEPPAATPLDMERSRTATLAALHPIPERHPIHERQATHVGSVHSKPPPAATEASARLPRATQTVPPAVRRHVLHRDHGRCVVPGCAHGNYLDVHHLRARAEGGTHEPDNLVTLCAGHHAALHDGRLSIEGRPSTGLCFRRADGSPYTEPPSARSVAAGEQVFRALRRLGFPERDSKTAVARVLETAETLCAASLLRAAITGLTVPCC